LAKELTDELRNEDGTYNLTGMTGSMRYMAPEVANSKPYTDTCDSYSFAILLWQMMSLKIPFELYTPRLLREKVYNGLHRRPPIDETWSQPIKICLKRSWAEDFKLRLTISQITAILKTECISAREGDDSGLEHLRRRSTFVFRQQ
jgi:serine/threonine protein kinase